MVRGEKTVLTRANIKSYSLRTTLPKGIAKQFELKEGDSILWEIKPSPDGKGLIIIVTPFQEKGSGKKKVEK
jgi:hypothetical protein